MASGLERALIEPCDLEFDLYFRNWTWSRIRRVVRGRKWRRFLSKIRVLRLCARLDEVSKRVLFAGDQFRVSSAFISLGDFLINVWFDIIMRVRGSCLYRYSRKYLRKKCLTNVLQAMNDNQTTINRVLVTIS